MNKATLKEPEQWVESVHVFRDVFKLNVFCIYLICIYWVEHITDISLLCSLPAVNNVHMSRSDSIVTPTVNNTLPHSETCAQIDHLLVSVNILR